MTELGHPAGGIFLEHRLDGEALRLDDAGLAAGLRRAVGEPAQEVLFLHVPGADPWLLAMVDRPALEFVDDLVDAGRVTDGRGVGPQRPAVDDQRHLDDVRVLGASMLLDRQLDERIGPVVEDSLEPPELAFRVAADALWDLDVLTLDDRPHAHLPRHRGPPSVAGSPGGWAGRPAFGRVYTASADRSESRQGSPVPRLIRPAPYRSLATVIAETPTAPASMSGVAQAARLAPVVTTSSTRMIQRPANGPAGRTRCRVG